VPSEYGQLELTATHFLIRITPPGLARPGRADEHDQARLGDVEQRARRCWHWSRSCARRRDRVALAEHCHLRRRADLGIQRANRQQAHAVAVPRGSPLRPGGELGTRPLEAVVGVAQLALGQCLSSSSTGSST
jgi:hypothetical protein